MGRPCNEFGELDDEEAVMSAPRPEGMREPMTDERLNEIARTYTLPEEPGTSLRAAGFSDQGLTAGGEHSRPSRYRKPALRPDRKRRWMRKL